MRLPSSLHALAERRFRLLWLAVPGVRRMGRVEPAVEPAPATG